MPSAKQNNLVKQYESLESRGSVIFLNEEVVLIKNIKTGTFTTFSWENFEQLLEASKIVDRITKKGRQS